LILIISIIVISYLYSYIFRIPEQRECVILHEDVCWLLCKRQENRTLGKWITKRRSVKYNITKRKRIWHLMCRNGRYCMTKVIQIIKKTVLVDQTWTNLRRTWEWKVCFCLLSHVLCLCIVMYDFMNFLPWNISCNILWNISEIFQKFHNVFPGFNSPV